MVGRVIGGKYEITRVIRAGGMGVVYEAVHHATGRHVAVKLLQAGNPQQNQELVARFHREARAAGSVDTEHIVQVIDAGSDPESNAPYMVMELLKGEDLQDLLKREHLLPPDVALRICSQALVGLTKAHAVGIIHRDIKPANLFLSMRDDETVIVKLLDFGIAKIRSGYVDGAVSSELTRTGNVLGSPQYMSPEQAKGLKTVDFRTDIWSLGTVLYKMLASRTPFQDIDTFGQVILALCTESPPHIQDLAPWVKPDVAAIVHHALEFRPEERFESAQAMLDAIRPLLSEGPAIKLEMLRALSFEERRRCTIRYGAPKPGSRSIHEESTQVGIEKTINLRGQRNARPDLAPDSNRAPRRHPSLFWVAGILGSLGVAGVATTIRSVRSTASPPLASIPLSSGVAGLPSPVAAAAPPSTAESTEQLVHVAVIPPTASVQVNGNPVPATSGSVPISGVLGSIHRVRVSAGGRTVDADVAVTKEGAMPARVVVEPKLGQARESLVRPTPAHPGTAPIAAAAPSPTPVARPKPAPTELGAAKTME